MQIYMQEIKVEPWYKMTELGVIPEDWNLKKIWDFTGASAWWTPSTLVPDFWWWDIKWMSSWELNNKFIYDVVGRITNYWLQNSSTKIIPKECVLMWLAWQWKTRWTVAINLVELCTNQSIASIYPSSSHDSYFLYYNLDNRYKELRQLSTWDWWRWWLNLTIIKSLNIALPSNRKEQKNIAKTLSDIDGLINSLDELIVKKEKIKQWTMQELLTWKRRLPWFDWEWGEKSLWDIWETIRWVSYNWEKDLSLFDNENTVRLLRSNNIKNWILIHTDLQFVNKEKVNQQQYLRNWDIFICMANGSKALVWKSAFFEEIDIFDYTFWAFMWCYRLIDKQYCNKFIYYNFQSWKYRKYIDVLLSGSSINNLKPSDINSIMFSFPKLDKQKAIAEVLSDMDNEIENLKTKRDKYKEIKEWMMQELLTWKTRLV